MQIYKCVALCILTFFLIFTFSACQKIADVKISTQQKFVEREIEENAKQIIDEKQDLVSEGAIGLGFVPLNGEINYDDFLSNPNLTSQENQSIKRIIIDVIFYMFGFESDYNDIFLAVDNQESKVWFEQDNYYEEGWTIVDEINILRELEKDFKLASIDANFMMRYYITNDSHYHVSVPLYLTYDDGSEGGYFLYDFYFKKIEDKHKLIGLAIGR